jgi:hypothetical protein
VYVELDVLYSGTHYNATAITDANGHYQFTHLQAATYHAVVNSATLPGGMAQTYDLDGIGTAHTAAVVLNTDVQRTDVDFGYTGTGSLGDRVWYDVDRDGVQDIGEIGISGATVQIEADINPGVAGYEYNATVTTGANGQYLFDHLPFVEYRITVLSRPSGFDSQTYDLDGILNNQSVTTLSSGNQHDLRLDFGYVGAGSLGDLVWDDSNANRTADAGESGLVGVHLTLQGDLDRDGTADFTLTASTDGSGNYLFDDLPNAAYTVIVDVTPAGFIQSYDYRWNTTDGLNNQTAYDMSVAADFLAVDFGYTRTGSLGDFVWYDANADGVQDSSEPGFSGAQVTLVGDVNLDGVADTLTTTTDASGHYVFNDLPFGSYAVTVASGLPGGTRATHDLDGISTPDSAAASLTAGQNRRDVDFGYTGTGSIGDQLWEDKNGNGAMDGSEPQLAGVQVCIGVDLNGDGNPDYQATTTTDAHGVYIFDNLPAGRHSICVNPDTLPSGIRPSYDPDGNRDNRTLVTLGAGEDYRTADFGYRYPPDPERLFGGGREDVFFYPSEEILYQQQALPVSPIYTGHAEPGTTLFLTLYDSMGNQVGYQSIMADTAGNWLASFPGTLLYDIPHHMAIDQTISAYNDSTSGMFNMRTYFSPNFSSMVFSSPRLDVGTVFALLPSTVMESMHGSNLAVFDIRWNNFHGYEFLVPSVNPSNIGH